MIGRVSSARSRKIRVTQTPEVTPEESLTGELLSSRQNNSTYPVFQRLLFIFRGETWAGVSQYPNLPPNANYYFTIFFKALNQNDAWMRITLMAAVSFGATKTTRIPVCMYI